MTPDSRDSADAATLNVFAGGMILAITIYHHQA